MNYNTKLFSKYFFIFLISVSQSMAATYYSNTTAGTDANNLSYWSLNTDGSGGAPANWAHTFVIQSGHTMSMSATWGDGSSSMDVSITSGATLNLNGNILSSTMNSLTLNGDGNASIGAIYNGSATVATIQEDIILGANTTIKASSGNVTICGNISLSSYTLTFMGASNFTVSGVISGTGAIIRDDNGDVELAGANTFSGLATITNGSFTVSNSLGLGSTAAGVVVNSGILYLTGGVSVTNETMSIAGTFRNLSGNNFWTGAITLSGATPFIQSDAGAFIITGNINLGSNLLTLSGASTDANEISGIISGTGIVKKSGTSTWALSGANTFSGGVLLHKNTLCVNNSNALGTGTLTIIQGALNNTLTLDNTSGAPITVANNPVSITNNFRFVGTNNLNLGSGNITLNADISCNAIAGTLTVDGVVSGAYAFTKNGNGTLVFNATNTYTGATTINAGILQIANVQGTGTTAGGVTVNSGGTLALSGGIAVGAEALTLVGTGYSSAGALRNISGNNSWAGAITLSTSATRINSDANTLTLSNTITNSNIDLTIGGSGDCVVSNVIGSGSGAFTKDGSGTVYLNATNTYTGETIVNNGTVLLGANQVLSNNLTINAGTFDVTASNYNVSLTGNFSNDDTFTARNGTVTLNGNTNQSIGGTVDAAFYNLTLNNSSTGATLGVSTSVTNTLDLTAGKLNTQGYELTIGTNASNGNITNGNASNYIIAYDNSGTIGEVKRMVNSNTVYDFPIGDNSNYTPIAVTLNSNSGLSNASVSMHTNPATISEMSPAITTYIARNWVTSQSGITSPDYDVSYTYVAGDVTGTEADILPVNYYGTSDWQKPTGSLFTTGTEVGAGSINTGTKSLSWTGISSMRKLGGAGNTSVPLPVDFIQFTASKQGENVKLNWLTASEKNNDYYTIEKSVDGIEFEEIGNVKGSNNSNQVISYLYLDNNVNENLLYYRIKQTDFDKKFSYSNIISIKLENQVNNKTIVASYNLMGQKVTSDYRGLVIIFFSDGSSEKQMR